MKIKETFIIEKHDERTWRDRVFHEYLIKNVLEREDGSLIETHLSASANDSVGKLEVGAKYNLTVFITSRKSGEGETERHWPSFRITAAEKIADALEKTPAPVVQEEPMIGDEVPFNDVR